MASSILLRTVDRWFPLATRRRRYLETLHFYYRAAKWRIKSLNRKKEVLEKRHLPIVLPCLTKPEVSIIIPAYNKFAYTYTCLKSILERSGDIDYEVIVVDNASTDETVMLHELVKNLVIIRNKENQGFVAACNAGAAAARGRYLLFLNNDTKVKEGWLGAMVEAAKRERTVGLVGAKLIYPDGRLQEGGGIVWNDLANMAWNYGRNQDPDNFEYNYLKEADYCSGACILITKELFDKVGGLDTRYAPAYYEDTDLAFTVREHGYKVVYQPRAEVVHFEGVTAGRKTTIGIKKYQVINQEKFYEKWKGTLEKEHFPSSVNVFLARDRSRGKKVIVVIDNNVPTYDKDAGSLCIYMYLKLFIEEGFKVIFMPYNLSKLEPYTTELQQMGIEVIYGPFNFSKWLYKNGQYIDYVFLARPHVAASHVKKIKQQTKAKILYFTHDLHYLREFRRYEVEKRSEILTEAERLKKLEFSVFDFVDCVLTPSNKEVEIIKANFPDKKAMCIPLFFYDNLPKEDTMAPFQSRSNIIFVGGFRHIPNIDAVVYFVKEVWPAVKKSLPLAKFYIVGSDPPAEVKNLENSDIIVTGYVVDLANFFNDARVFVAPLRYGAGVKGKIVTSMSYGVPVVTTTIGNEGIDLIDGDQCLVAGSGDEVAAKVVELYQNCDLWNKLSYNSREVVKKHFSRDAAKDKMKKALEI